MNRKLNDLKNQVESQKSSKEQNEGKINNL